MKEKYKKDFDEVVQVVVSVIKIMKPSLTDDEAKSVIVNLGNYIQLERLKMKKKKISNEPVRKVIEKRFDMYPYQGNDEFEELKNKLKEKVK